MKATKTQLQVLRWMVKHQAQNGFMPTIREICRRFGWAGTNAARNHLRGLVSAGLVEAANGKARAHVVTPSGRRAAR